DDAKEAAARVFLAATHGRLSEARLALKNLAPLDAGGAQAARLADALRARAPAAWASGHADDARPLYELVGELDPPDAEARARPRRRRGASRARARPRRRRRSRRRRRTASAPTRATSPRARRATSPPRSARATRARPPWRAAGSPTPRRPSRRPCAPTRRAPS